MHGQPIGQTQTDQGQFIGQVMDAIHQEARLCAWEPAMASVSTMPVLSAVAAMSGLRMWAIGDASLSLHVACTTSTSRCVPVTWAIAAPSPIHTVAWRLI